MAETAAVPGPCSLIDWARPFGRRVRHCLALATLLLVDWSPALLVVVVSWERLCVVDLSAVLVVVTMMRLLVVQCFVDPRTKKRTMKTMVVFQEVVDVVTL